MKINLVWIGKAKYKYTNEAVDLYLSRLKHYCKVEVLELKDIKSNNATQQKKEEAKLFLKHIKKAGYNICLDERGKEFTSLKLASHLEAYDNRSLKELNIIIGGAFGFQSDVLQACDEKWSLSKMTLPHDLCRILITEQLYRAFSILRGEKYHNE